MTIISATRQVLPDFRMTTGGEPPLVWVGIDTHQLIHHAAVIDDHRRPVADQQFPATTQGYQDLTSWVCAHGQVAGIGIEQTGTYGAGITRHARAQGLTVWEVNQPDKAVRASQGKSDPIDAVMAARAVMTGRANVVPKTSSGVVEAIRVLHLARSSAVKERTKVYSQVRDVITTAPQEVREDLLGHSAAQRVKAILNAPVPTPGEAVVLVATMSALRSLAVRVKQLDTTVKELTAQLEPLVAATAPSLVAMPQLGVVSAAQLLITAGQNIDRIAAEAGFARLCGVAPIPVSSGKVTGKYRLHRGGDRHANSALYMIVIGRMRSDPRTQEYVQRRTNQGKTKQEIIRCLKRYVARDVFHALKHDLAALDDL